MFHVYMVKQFVAILRSGYKGLDIPSHTVTHSQSEVISADPSHALVSFLLVLHLSVF